MRVLRSRPTASAAQIKNAHELAADNAYFRTALLSKQFGAENITLQTLTVASAFLDRGWPRNLRQAQ